ncbi:MAG: ral secretion pathway protein [Hyphomicrobiales bacterium]|nr:ral secretion pathway protein [Hyphomicrobiales bacterium]
MNAADHGAPHPILACKRGRRRARDQRGFIIVAVLWILGALATLATIYGVYVIDTAVSFSTHDQRLQADSLFTASLELTSALLGRPDAPPNGRFNIRLGNADVAVNFRAENTRIDLNVAPKQVLAALFVGLGARAGLAEGYADNIIAWRTPPDAAGSGAARDFRPTGMPYPARGAPFPHTGELALVPGLPEILVDRALPFVTVYSGAPQINIMGAAPEVLAALPGMNPNLLYAILAQRQAEPQNVQKLAALLGPAQPLATGHGSKAVRVTPQIVFDDGQRMSADIVIFILDNGTEPYRVLSWRDSSDDPLPDERPRPRKR